MNVTEYRTTSDLLADHPNVIAEAAVFRVTRYLEGEAAAVRRIGEHRMPLVNRLHELRAAEEARRPKRHQRLPEARARKRAAGASR